MADGWLRTAELSVGDVVAVQLAVDPDPDLVEPPEELAALFDEDPLAERARRRRRAEADQGHAHRSREPPR